MFFIKFLNYIFYEYLSHKKIIISQLNWGIALHISYRWFKEIYLQQIKFPFWEII